MTVKVSRERRLHDGRRAGRRIRLPQKAPDRIDLVRVLRTDPWAAAMVLRRGPAVVAWFAARVAAADLTDPTGPSLRSNCPADLRAEAKRVRRQWPGDESDDDFEGAVRDLS